jgi:hypothetical protein
MAMKSTAGSLTELALRYFRKKGFRTEVDVTLEGASGLSRTFDFLVARSNEKHIAKVHDWKRTVGVNMIINLDKASEDVGLRRPILVSEKFSSHAKAYANRKGVVLLTKRELGIY